MSLELFKTVLTDFNKKSNVFFVDSVVLEVEKICFVRTTCNLQNWRANDTQCGHVERGTNQ